MSVDLERELNRIYSREWITDLEYFLNKLFNKDFWNASNVVGGGDKNVK